MFRHPSLISCVKFFFVFFGQRNRLTSVNSRPHTAVVSYDVLFKVLGILDIFGALFSEPQNLSQISLRLFFAQMNFLIFRTCPDCKKSDSFYPVIFHNYFLGKFHFCQGSNFLIGWKFASPNLSVGAKTSQKIIFPSATTS